MRKLFIAAVAALSLGFGVGAVGAARNEPPRRTLPPPAVANAINDGMPPTTHPTGRPTEPPGQTRRQVPVHTGEQMTHTTNTVVVFK